MNNNYNRGYRKGRVMRNYFEDLPQFVVNFVVNLNLEQIFKICSGFGAEFYAHTGLTWEQFVSFSKLSFDCKHSMKLNACQVELLYKKFNLLNNYRQIDLSVEIKNPKRFIKLLEFEDGLSGYTLCVEPNWETLFDLWVKQGCPEVLYI